MGKGFWKGLSMNVILGIVFFILLILFIISLGLLGILVLDCFKGGKLTELSHKDLPWVTIVYGVIALVLWYGVKATNPFITTVNSSKNSEKVERKAKPKTKIYTTEVTKMIVEKNGEHSRRFFIYLKGTTNAPNGSAIMAQEVDKDSDSYSNRCVCVDEYDKVKNGKFKVLIDDTFNQNWYYFKIGQTYKVKLFAVKDVRLNDVGEIWCDIDPQEIPKFVVKALKEKYIPTYTIKTNKKMKDIVNSN